MMLQIYDDSNVSGKKGFRWYIKKFKEISLNKLPAEAKVTETGISLFWIFHLHGLNGANGKNDTVDIPYRYIVYETIRQNINYHKQPKENGYVLNSMNYLLNF